MRSGAKGFTLIEVLVAVAIAALLATALYSTFFSVLRATRAVEDGLDRYADAGRFLDRLGRELRSAYLKPGDGLTFFRGEALGERPELLFTSFSGPGDKGSLIAVRYFMGEDELGPKLYKEVWSPYVNERLRAEALRDIRAFDIAFLDKEWAGAWDSKYEQRLPRAVRATVRLADGAEFSTTLEVMVR